MAARQVRAREPRSAMLVLAAASLGLACGGNATHPAESDRFHTAVIVRGDGCDGCELVIDYLGRLGSSSDTLLMTAETMIAVRADGAFIAAPLSGDGEAVIFDSLGAVGRPFGRFGDGPGENGRILHVLPWLGDTVLFAGFDRLTFLSGDRGEGRTSRLARPSPSHRTVALPDEAAVVRNYSYPPDRQFVVFNEDGSWRVDMGKGWETGSRRDVNAALGELGPATESHLFWSAPQRYRVKMDLWNAVDGSLMRSFQDTVSWFVPYDSASLYRFMLEGNDVENPPPPFLRGIRETADSVLLLLYNVPARDWTRSRDTLPVTQRGLRRVAYDAVLDLRDPTSGRSLLTVWSSTPFARLVNDTLLADRQQTEDGFWIYEIYRVRFRR